MSFSNMYMRSNGLTIFTAPDDLRTDDPAGLQNLIEGLFLGIKQKKRDLYRVTGKQPY